MNTKEERETDTGFNKVTSPKKHHYAYVMFIDDKYIYIGSCSSNSKKDIDLDRIYNNSGNPLRVAYVRGIISYREYKERCQIIRVQSFDTRDEALDEEEFLISLFKELFEDKCINLCTGNRHRGAKIGDKRPFPHINGQPIRSIR